MGVLGFRDSDLINVTVLKKELLPYIYPDQNIIKGKKIKAIFIGYYFDWNNQENYKTSERNGFTPFRMQSKVAI